MTRLLFAAYFLEAGLILIVAPWSGFWERNFFIGSLPTLDRLMASPFVRGGVSGVGLITAVAGLAELGGVVAARRGGPPAATREAGTAAPPELNRGGQ
jgi:hypothetical protein